MRELRALASSDTKQREPVLVALVGTPPTPVLERGAERDARPQPTAARRTRCSPRGVSQPTASRRTYLLRMPVRLQKRDVASDPSSACGLGLQTPPAARRRTFTSRPTRAAPAARRPRSHASTRGLTRERRSRRGGRFVTHAGLGVADRGLRRRTLERVRSEQTAKLHAHRSETGSALAGSTGARRSPEYPNVRFGRRPSMQQTATRIPRPPLRRRGRCANAETTTYERMHAASTTPLHAAELEAAAAPAGGGARAHPSRCARVVWRRDCLLFACEGRETVLHSVTSLGASAKRRRIANHVGCGRGKV
jgi:hypothetical protein